MILSTAVNLQQKFPDFTSKNWSYSVKRGLQQTTQVLIVLLLNNGVYLVSMQSMKNKVHPMIPVLMHAYLFPLTLFILCFWDVFIQSYSSEFWNLHIMKVLCGWMDSVFSNSTTDVSIRNMNESILTFPSVAWSVCPAAETSSFCFSLPDFFCFSCLLSSHIQQQELRKFNFLWRHLKSLWCGVFHVSSLLHRNVFLLHMFDKLQLSF